MESSSATSRALGLRQLMSLDSPTVDLGRRCVVVKEERQEGPSSSPPPPPSGVPAQVTVKIEKTFLSACSLCTVRPGNEALSVFCSPDAPGGPYLRSLVGAGALEDLVFCSVCCGAVNRLFELRTLRREMDDLEIRIKAVVRLRGPALPTHMSTCKS